MKEGLVFMKVWTTDGIAALETKDIEGLRTNAARLKKAEIVALCDDELARRRPEAAKRKRKDSGEDHRGQYVSEFHFVCPTEAGLTRNQDGTIWTGTWVVAEQQVEDALKYGSLVALHAAKAERSYLQGTIRAWRKSPRQSYYSGDQLAQTSEGIDFLFLPSDTRLPWQGSATGEKGYAWKSIGK